MATIQNIDNELGVTARPKINANFQALKTEVEAATTAIAGKEDSGTAATAVAAHASAPDPHPNYALESDVASALAGKAAVSHSHAISDSTGLQAALDLKAPKADPSLTGTVAMDVPSPNVTDLGTVASGTVTLSSTTAHNRVVLSGSSATIALPSSPPDGFRTLDISITGNVALTVTIPSLKRLGATSAGTTITFDAATAGVACIAFRARGGAYTYYVCDGDNAQIETDRIAGFFHDVTMALASSTNIASAASTVAYIDSVVDDLQVPYENLSLVPAGTLVGNSTGSAANAEDISIGSGLSLSGGVLSATAGGATTPSEITALDIDWSASTVFTDTRSSSATYTFSNTSDGMTIRVLITTTGNYTITWPAGSVGSGVSVAHTSTSTAWYQITRVGAAYLVTRLENGLTIDTAPPVVTSITINTAGTQATVNFDKDVTVTDGSGFTMSATAGGVTPTYASGTGTSALVLTLSRTIYAGETVTLSYDGSGGIVGEANAVALADFTGTAVTNNSTASQYLFAHDFEGANTAPSGVTSSGTTPVYNYTTSPAPLVGTQSLGYDGNVIEDWGSTVGTFYGFLHIDIGGASTSAAIYLRNAAGVVQAEIRFQSDRIVMLHGATSATILGTSDASANVMTSRSVVWIRYIEESGGGGNGTLGLAINRNSSSETKPAEILTITTGTGDAVQQMVLLSPSATRTYVADKWRGSTSAIGNSPL